jgi:HAD superfamily phosphoserine phosphatase-like hydrolase
VSPAVSKYQTVVFDVDSTLTGIEGVDWLAARRDAETEAFVLRLTERVMAGDLPIEEAYGVRLQRIAPTRQEVAALAEAYRDAVAPDARATIGTLLRARVRVVAVSGGLRDAVLPFCRGIGFAESDVRAVSAEWTARGDYAGFDRRSPLATQVGKATVIREMELPRPILMVGDGSTDVEPRDAGVADEFAAYTGFTRRSAVVSAADFVVESFAELLERVFSTAS